jgi:inner membrane protein
VNLAALGPAHWLILAFVLGILEALFPGAVFLWFAIAAALVGALSFLLPIGWQAEVVLFGVLALASIAVWRQLRRDGTAAAGAPLNKRGQQYEGQVCELLEPIHNGIGRARVGDGVWTVSGPDLPAGARVRVVAVEGTVLRVVAA